MKSFRQYLRQTLYESDPQKYDDVGKKIDNETSEVKETPKETPKKTPDIDISGDDTDIIVPTQFEWDDQFHNGREQQLPPWDLVKEVIRAARESREQRLKDGKIISNEDQAIKRRLGITRIISKDKLLLKTGEGIRNGTMKRYDPDPPVEPPEEMDEPTIG